MAAHSYKRDYFVRFSNEPMVAARRAVINHEGQCIGFVDNAFPGAVIVAEYLHRGLPVNARTMRTSRSTRYFTKRNTDSLPTLKRHKALSGYRYYLISEHERVTL